MSEALQRGGSRPVELHLNPAELGRVKMSVQTVDGSVIVHVFADRPETLDLMRRHVDLLANDFRAIGYGKAEFSFAQQGSGEGGGAFDTADDGHRAQRSDAESDTQHATDDIGTATPAMHVSDRVDIRI
ncbi:flagellar hook-length control protein FliK [Roseovarius sp. 2305UL8-3]|uniref:flagellar hook-length control protein FliK n=1 Tax=Roseovarius conchicola TaxID=3121636 RepID=UPI003527DC3E